MQFWCCGLFFFCFAPANAFAPTALMHGLEDVQLCTNARVEKMWNWWVFFSPQACALTSMQAQGINYARNQPRIRSVQASLNTTENCSWIAAAWHCQTGVDILKMYRQVHCWREHTLSEHKQIFQTNLETSNLVANDMYKVVLALLHAHIQCIVFFIYILYSTPAFNCSCQLGACSI